MTERKEEVEDFILWAVREEGLVLTEEEAKEALREAKKKIWEK